ncbi:hypothetical protein [Natronococcus occultus]|uniref:Uncharacterized protein n=1 Tax=Natronococcus occultus SP4 TaxID=694430 RepID=L0JZ61_9EURY|nr:hypothetical protein [Natronococcus occultus]AGB37163.1 hypothetical protein Natoc_1349 [Natronococcus occultus SP4]
MTKPEPFGQGVRVLAIVALLAALAGLVVWAGASPAEPMEQEPPNEVEVEPDRGSYVGEDVILGGEVVETDPLVIATRASGYGQFTILVDGKTDRNVEGDLESGDQVTTYGTLEDEETLAAERVTVQNPSDTRYMMLVSLVGGLLVVGRVLRDWRFDLGRLAFVPRDRARPRSDDSSDSALGSGSGNARAQSDDGLEAPAGGDRGG